MMRTPVLAPVLLGLSVAGAAAQPPIQSPQDAACRSEAEAKVFSTPDPQGLGPYAIGKRIYTACMRRTSAPAGRGKARRNRDM
ncbi:hypothetical protein [Methylobacterium organophilum]|uniref:Uncharacterized protein n=1 Tax=Methylobacterium organophilum TaxID=410 RepID=A0ABQ4TC43_METOR|nr:hypothetical protein [Methylobacterium organophilum]UMY15750.1 hypothetical protein MMB17_13460 [Methylobacterium organophilum]GJE28219.1 hypothetical protein LKMONMHP_3086 [Methylobacterium organophilum]